MDTRQGPQGGPAGFLVFVVGIDRSFVRVRMVTTWRRLRVQAPVHCLANTMVIFARGLNQNPDQQKQIEALLFQKRTIRAVRHMILRPAKEGRVFRRAMQRFRSRCRSGVAD